MTTHQARSTNSRASASMVPHSGVGGCAPRPREAERGGVENGGGNAESGLHDQRRHAVGQDFLDHQAKACRRRLTLRGGDVILSTSRRSRRRGQCARNAAAARWRRRASRCMRPGPRMATMTMASSRLGSVSTMSISRMMAISTNAAEEAGDQAHHGADHDRYR